MRGFADGATALLMPLHFAALGFSTIQIGILSAVALFGSAVTTLTVGMAGWRFSSRALLIGAALALSLTGLAIGMFSAFWPILLVSAVGLLNPSAGENSMFLPLEHERLARNVSPEKRTALFARYSLVGSLSVAFGSLAAGAPELVSQHLGLELELVVRGAFMVYALLGLAMLYAYSLLPRLPTGHPQEVRTGLVESRPVVFKLAGLFALDALGGGFSLRALLALWLYQVHGLSMSATGTIFFASDLLAAVSYLAAVPLARRLGLVRTMAYTHIPASVCLIVAPFITDVRLLVAVLVLRNLLAYMDVPTRVSYVMAVVPPAERASAATLTTVPRSFAGAISPFAAAALYAMTPFAWPLLIAGTLKVAYNLILLKLFLQLPAPEERANITAKSGN